MDLENNNIEKICSFCVSDWHLVTMLLPYINKNINQEINVIAILENDIEENVKILLERLNLNNKEKILNINYKKTNAYKYENISDKMENKVEGKTVIIINGKKEYIEAANINIEKWIQKNKIKQEDIKIINCYEVTEFNGNINDILDKHDKVLNTSGEKEINEVFEGYKKNNKISKAK